MAATLLFEHEGWTVATAAWSAASKPGGPVEICYPWSSAGTFAWLDNATGTAKVSIDMKMNDFLNRVQRDGIVDLRKVSA